MGAAIRRADESDWPNLWPILEPMIRAGETYPLDRDMDEAAARAYWFQPSHRVYLAESAGQVVGTYYLRPNNRGGGAHVANCGYVVRPDTFGQGVAGAMAAHSQEEARALGFTAMQFNFVISANTRAVALWTRLGFAIVGRVPKAFRHPREGLVDAFVMTKAL